MPSSNTHGYFCEDVYDKLNKNIKNKIKDTINYFKVFGKGLISISSTTFI